jgi:hypothetical protein
MAKSFYSYTFWIFLMPYYAATTLLNCCFESFALGQIRKKDGYFCSVFLLAVYSA